MSELLDNEGYVWDHEEILTPEELVTALALARAANGIGLVMKEWPDEVFDYIYEACRIRPERDGAIDVDRTLDTLIYRRVLSFISPGLLFINHDRDDLQIVKDYLEIQYTIGIKRRRSTKKPDKAK